jgi:hypothetical protein
MEYLLAWVALSVTMPSHVGVYQVLSVRAGESEPPTDSHSLQASNTPDPSDKYEVSFGASRFLRDSLLTQGEDTDPNAYLYSLTE